MGCPLDYRCRNNASPQILIQKILGSYLRKHVLEQDISPLCHLCTSQQIDTYFHLLSCCTNKHMNNLRNNWYKNSTHALATILLVHPVIDCFMWINDNKHNEHTPDNSTASWLLPCTCHLPGCIYFAQLKPCILCIIGVPQTTKPPSPQSHTLKCKHMDLPIVMIDSPPMLLPKNSRNMLSYKLGWPILSPIIITAWFQGTTHTTMTETPTRSPHPSY